MTLVRLAGIEPTSGLDPLETRTSIHFRFFQQVEK